MREKKQERFGDLEHLLVAIEGTLGADYNQLYTAAVTKSVVQIPEVTLTSFSYKSKFQLYTAVVALHRSTLTVFPNLINVRTAQLVRHRSAEHKISGSNPTSDTHNFQL